MAISAAAVAAIAMLLSTAVGTGINHIERATDREYNSSEAEKQREFEAQQAQLQRDYETQMSNTAIEREYNQLTSVGINPAMFYSNGGSGASTPSGASAHGSSASTSSPHTNLGSAMSGAASMISAFNNDKDSSNNINLKQALGMISNVASILK